MPNGYEGRRSRVYPHLSDYLNYTIHLHGPHTATSSTATAALMAVVGFLVALPLLSVGERASNLVFMQSLTMGGVTGLAAYIFHGLFGGGTKEGRENHSIEIARRLHRAKSSSRLHHILHPAAGHLLEEAAEVWKSIRAELMSGIWNSPDLPSHWQTIAKQIQDAADEAIEEALQLCVGYLSRPKAKDDLLNWKELSEEAIAEGRLDRHPPALQPVIKLALKLKELSREVHDASTGVVLHPTAQVEPRSAAGIDLLIHELHTMADAEKELHEHVKS